MPGTREPRTSVVKCTSSSHLQQPLCSCARSSAARGRAEYLAIASAHAARPGLESDSPTIPRILLMPAGLSQLWHACLGTWQCEAPAMPCRHPHASPHRRRPRRPHAMTPRSQPRGLARSVQMLCFCGGQQLPLLAGTVCRWPWPPQYLVAPVAPTRRPHRDRVASADLAARPSRQRKKRHPVSVPAEPRMSSAHGPHTPDRAGSASTAARSTPPATSSPLPLPLKPGARMRRQLPPCSFSRHISKIRGSGSLHAGRRRVCGYRPRP